MGVFGAPTRGADGREEVWCRGIEVQLCGAGERCCGGREEERCSYAVQGRGAV